MGKVDLASSVSPSKDSNNLNKSQTKRVRDKKRKVVSLDNTKLDKKSRLTTDTESEHESERTEGSGVDWFSPNYTLSQFTKCRTVILMATPLTQHSLIETV